MRYIGKETLPRYSITLQIRGIILFNTLYFFSSDEDSNNTHIVTENKKADGLIPIPAPYPISK